MVPDGSVATSCLGRPTAQDTGKENGRASGPRRTSRGAASWPPGRRAALARGLQQHGRASRPPAAGRQGLRHDQLSIWIGGAGDLARGRTPPRPGVGAARSPQLPAAPDGAPPRGARAHILALSRERSGGSSRSVTGRAGAQRGSPGSGLLSRPNSFLPGWAGEASCGRPLPSSDAERAF